MEEAEEEEEEQFKSKLCPLRRASSIGGGETNFLCGEAAPSLVAPALSLSLSLSLSSLIKSPGTLLLAPVLVLPPVPRVSVVSNGVRGLGLRPPSIRDLSRH